MQDGMPDDQVELTVREGQRLGVRRLPLHVEPERAAIAHGDVHHALADIRDDGGPGQACLHEVEGEESRARADLEHPLGGPPLLPGHMDVAVAGVGDAPLVVGDAPLLVVGGRFPVVVDDVRDLRIRPGFLHAGFVDAHDPVNSAWPGPFSMKVRMPISRSRVPKRLAKWTRSISRPSSMSVSMPRAIAAFAACMARRGPLAS